MEREDWEHRDTEILNKVTDLYFFIFIYRLRDDVNRQFGKHTFMKQGVQSISITGPEALEVRNFMERYFKSHYLTALDYDIHQLLRREDKRLKNLKDECNFDILPQSEIDSVLQTLSKEMGPHPAGYIRKQTLKNSPKYSAIITKKKETNFVINKLEQFCRSQEPDEKRETRKADSRAYGESDRNIRPVNAKKYPKQQYSNYEDGREKDSRGQFNKNYNAPREEKPQVNPDEPRRKMETGFKYKRERNDQKYGDPQKTNNKPTRRAKEPDSLSDDSVASRDDANPRSQNREINDGKKYNRVDRGNQYGNTNRNSEEPKRRRDEEVALEFTDKELFLVLWNRQLFSELESDDLIAYTKIDNLFLRGDIDRCEDVKKLVKSAVDKWDLLAFELKYSVNMDNLARSVNRQAQLKILSSAQLQEEAKRIEREYMTEKFSKIVRGFRSRGDYILLIFRSTFTKEVKEALFKEVYSKLEKEKEAQLPIEEVTPIASTHKLSVSDFDQDHFKEYLHAEGIDIREVRIQKLQGQVSVTLMLNMPNFNKQKVAAYFTCSKYLFLPPGVKFEASFVEQVEVKHAKVSISTLQSINSKYSYQEIEHDTARQEEIEDQIQAKDSGVSQERRHMLFFFVIQGVRNMCELVGERFREYRQKEMESEERQSVVWKIGIPDLVKCNLYRQQVRDMVEQHISSAIIEYEGDCKMVRIKPQKDYAFNVKYQRSKEGMELIKARFEGLVTNELKTYQVAEFRSISEVSNIEGAHKCGIFAEDEGDLYMISFQSLDKESKELQRLIVKERIIHKMVLDENNYYSIVKQFLEQNSIPQVIVKDYIENEKHVFEFCGYRFLITRLMASINNLMQEAKKSLDFDFMYITSGDKKYLEESHMVQELQKNLDVDIKVEPSNQKNYSIVLSNHNRIVVTTCDIDRYNVHLRVTSNQEDLNDTNRQLVEPKQSPLNYPNRPSHQEEHFSCCFPEQGIVYIQESKTKDINVFVETLFSILTTKGSEFMDVKLNVSYPLKEFLNAAMVYMNSHPTLENVHICLLKEQVQEWEAMHQGLQNKVFTLTKAKEVQLWEYNNGKEWIKFPPQLILTLEGSAALGECITLTEDLSLGTLYNVVVENVPVSTSAQNPSFWNKLFSPQPTAPTVTRRIYLDSVLNRQRFVVSSAGSNTMYINLNPNKKIMEKHRRLINAGATTISMCVLEYNPLTKSITDLMTGTIFRVKMTILKVHDQVPMSYQFKSLFPLEKITFQSDKSKCHFIGGAKHKITDALRKSRKLKYLLTLLPKIQHNYIYPIQERVSRKKVNVCLLKSLVEENQGRLEMQKYKNWREQNEAFVCVSNQDRMTFIQSLLEKTDAVDKGDSTLMLMSPESTEFKSMSSEFSFATIKRIFKVHNPTMEALYQSSVRAGDTRSRPEFKCFYANQGKDISVVLSDRNVSFNIVTAFNKRMNLINFYDTALRCYNNIQSYREKKMLYCKVLSNAIDHVNGEIVVNRNNMALPLYLIEY